MSEGIDQFMREIGGLIQAMQPRERLWLSRRLARGLRSRNAARIKANAEPDGGNMPARQGDRWQMRGLKAGETLRQGQRFHHFRQRNLTAAYVRDEGDRLIVRQSGDNHVQGFLKKNIYLQGGRLRQKMMFQKLPRTRYLKTRAHTDEAAIGFMRGFAGRIAAEHHHGDTAKNQPARVLLGFSDEDIEFIRATVLDAIATAK